MYLQKLHNTQKDICVIDVSRHNMRSRAKYLSEDLLSLTMWLVFSILYIDVVRE
jgi:hypothetical protein